jgi:hypothetical protein
MSYFGAPQSIRGPDLAIMSMKKILKANKNVRLLIFSRRVVGGTTAEDQYHKLKEEQL